MTISKFFLQLAHTKMMPFIPSTLNSIDLTFSLILFTEKITLLQNEVYL